MRSAAVGDHGGDLPVVASEEPGEPGSCRSLPLTLLFWVLFAVTQSCHRNVALQHSVKQILAEAFSAPTAPGLGGPAYDNSSAAADGWQRAAGVIASPQDILDWVGTSLVPQLWAGEQYGRGVFREFNRALGGLRIQQRRLGASTCPGSRALSALYNLTCYGRGAASPAGAAPLPGDVSADAHGLQTYWLDLARAAPATQAQIQKLRDAHWLSIGTHEVAVQSVFLNAQVSLIAFAETRFVLELSGRLSTKSVFQTLPTEIYGSNWLAWFGDSFMLLLLGLFLVQEIMAVYSACRNSSLKKYCCRPMAIVNWFVVFFGIAFASFYGYVARELELLSRLLSTVPAPPGQAATSSSAVWPLGAAPPQGWPERRAALDGIFDGVARLAHTMQAVEWSTFWYTLLVVLKFLEAFEGSQRLSMIIGTLRQHLPDLGLFLAGFGLVFLNFALMAFFLFGHQLEEWSELHRAINSSFRVIMGDFDFQRMEDVAPISTVLWFWLFKGVVYGVLLSMLLAIMLSNRALVQRLDGKMPQSNPGQQAGEMLPKDKEIESNRSDADNSLGTHAGEVPPKGKASKQLRFTAIEDTLLFNPSPPSDPSPPLDLPKPSRLTGFGRRSQGQAEDAAMQSSLEALQARLTNDLHQVISTVRGLSDQLTDVATLPRLFKQLEDACWRYFWLEAGRDPQSKQQLLRVLTNSNPLPPAKSHAELDSTLRHSSPTGQIQHQLDP